METVVPVHPGLPLVGNTLAVARDPLGMFTRLQRQCLPSWAFWLCCKSIPGLVSNPDLRMDSTAPKLMIEFIEPWAVAMNGQNSALNINSNVMTNGQFHGLKKFLASCHHSLRVDTQLSLPLVMLGTEALAYRARQAKCNSGAAASALNSSRVFQT